MCVYLRGGKRGKQSSSDRKRSPSPSPFPRSPATSASDFFPPPAQAQEERDDPSSLPHQCGISTSHTTTHPFASFFSWRRASDQYEAGEYTYSSSSSRLGCGYPLPDMTAAKILLAELELVDESPPLFPPPPPPPPPPLLFHPVGLSPHAPARPTHPGRRRRLSWQRS